MQKLTIVFVFIVLVLFVLTGLYIRTSEQEKNSLKEQLASQMYVEPAQPDTATDSASTEGQLIDETPEAATASGQKQLGTIEGSLSFPSSGIPDTLEVCAENTQTNKLICTGEIRKSDEYTYGFGYTLELPEGDYTVYSRLPNDPYKAYYSDFVVCGLAASCPSHKPIVVRVTANMTATKIDPQDWYDSNQ